MRTTAFLIVCFLAWLVGGAALLAESLPGAGSAARGRGGDSGHGWVTVPVRSESSAVAVLHVPPRGPRVGDGSLRLAVQLPDAPEGMGAWDNRLYMVFGPEATGPEQSQRRVLVLAVEPGAIEGNWVVAGEGGRLPVLPSLPGEGRLAGFAISEHGPAALIDRAAEGPRLLVLRENAWAPVDLPEGAAAEPLHLVSSIHGLNLVAPGQGRAWSGRFASGGGPPIEWSDVPVDFEQPGGRAAPLPRGPLVSTGVGYLYWVETGDGGDGLQFWNATAQGCFLLGELRGIGERYSVAHVPGAGRVAVVWAQRLDAGEPRGEDLLGKGRVPPERWRTQVAEFSASTGRLFYRGPAQLVGPVSTQELRLLAVMLVVVMAIIMLFVLRPEREGAPLNLPRDVTLAEPVRRVIAGGIDLLVAAVLAGRLTGVSLAEMFSLTTLLTNTGPLIGFGVMLGIGIVLCTMGEWLVGRSLGKAVTGCEVVCPVVRPAAGSEQLVPVLLRPTLWRALGRNLIKWLLPPIALSGVFAPERRHRGDVVAGTAVVVRTEEDEAGAGTGGGE